MQILKSELGVMAMKSPEYYPFGKSNFFFEEMLNSFPDREFEVFFFSPLSWSDGKKSIEGNKFVNGKWISAEEEIPDIIYDLANSKHIENKDAIIRCRAYLRSSGKRMLNPFGLSKLLRDKVAFHKFLLSHNIPTLDCFPVAELRQRMEKAVFKGKRFFLKPTYGENGKGIFVIEQQKNQFNLFDNLGQAQTFSSYGKLRAEISDLVENPAQYFIQEEADIIRYDGLTFDFRAFAQNDGHQFRLTGLGARTGRKQAMTANLKTGGKALPVAELNDFFVKEYGRTMKEEEELIRQICINACHAIKQGLGDFLEIGFDILSTRKGPIIIEGNSKPNRWILTLISDYLADKDPEAMGYYQAQRAVTVRMPMLYTRHLLEQARNKQST